MYIKTLSIKNYRCFTDFTTNFSDKLNVIIGANNSGKTCILSAIDLISNINKHSISIHDFNKYEIKTKFKNEYLSNPPTIEIECTFLHSLNDEDELMPYLISFLSIETSETPSINKGMMVEGKFRLSCILKDDEVANYLKDVQSCNDCDEYLNVLMKYVEKYRWNCTHPETNKKIDLSEVSRLFANVKSISAERDINSVEDLVRKNIKSHIDDNGKKMLIDLQNKLSKELEKAIDDYLIDIKEISDNKEDKIGIGNGNIDIDKSISADVNSLESTYKLAVRDKDFDMTLPLSNNGVGYNNLIYMYFIVELVKRNKHDGAAIICFEEPEAHLHPAMQYKLLSYLKGLSNELFTQQIFVTTHSSNVTSAVGIDNLFLLSKNEISHKHHLIKLSSTIDNDDECKKYITKYLDVTKSDMLFAKNIIFVEGITEKILIPFFAKSLGYDLINNHVSIVDIGGRYFDNFLKLLNTENIDKKILCITDKDYQWEDEQASLEKYQKYVPEHYSRLVDKFTGDQFIFETQKNGGATFEDELFLANYNDNNFDLIRELFVCADAPKTFMDIFEKNKLNYELYYIDDKEANLNGTEKIISKFHRQFDGLIQLDKSNELFYKKLFFSNLFRYYAQNKSGTAFAILNNKKFEDIIVPDYIKEGLEKLWKK